MTPPRAGRRPSPRLAASCFLLAALALAACEDPSAVGLDVLDSGESDPRARTFAAETAEADSLADATGGASALDPAFGTFRAWAGRVDDPAFGVTTARAYADFSPPSDVPSRFRQIALDAAILALQLDGLYGETGAPITVDLYQVAEEWNAPAVRSDSTLPTEEEAILSFEIAPEDSLVEVRLPAEWVAENDATLRSLEAGQNFHGFEIRPREENGFARGVLGRSELRLISDFDADADGPDTLDFGAVELFTNVERDAEAGALPAGLVPLVDGGGVGLELTFDFAGLNRPAVTGAFVLLEADTTLPAPEGFERPVARTLTLYGLGQSVPVAITDAELDPETQQYAFSSAGLAAVLQNVLLSGPDEADFDAFAVGFPSNPSELAAIALCAEASAACAARPRAVILTVPTDD